MTLIFVKSVTFLYVLLFLLPSSVLSLSSRLDSLQSSLHTTELSENLNVIDDLIKRGNYYVAFEKINRSLSQKIKDELRLRLQIRKSIVLVNLSKSNEAEDILTPVVKELEKRKFRKSEAQLEVIYALGKLQFFKGYYKKSAKTFLKAIELHFNFPKDKNSFYNDILSEISLTYLLLGKYEECDSIMLKTNASPSILPLDKSKNQMYLAYSYHEQGLYEKADSVIQKSIKIREDILGSNHHRCADALEIWGSIKENQGLTAQADSMYKLIYKIRKNYFKEDHVLFAASLNGIASVLWIQGENEEAVDVYLEALTIIEKLQGKLHPEYINLLNNVAVSYVMLGKYNKGLELFLDIKKTSMKTLGKDNPEYGTNLNNLAFTYFKLGQYRKTKDIYEEALSFRARTLGENHPDYFSTLNNIGLLYSKLGEYETSETTYLKCKELCVKNLGVDHPHYAMVLNNLASVYDDIGDYKKCEEAYLESLVLYEKLNGKIHNSYATVKSNLGNLYKRTGRIEEARKYYEESAEILKQVHGENHERYATVLSTLGLMEVQDGNLNEAQTLLETANKIKLEALGNDHLSYAIGLANLATLFREKGEYKLSEDLYLQALEIEKNKISPTSETYISTLKSVLSLYKKAEDFENEFVFAEKLMDSQLSLMESGLNFMSEDQKIKFKNNTIGNFSYAKNIALRTKDQNFLSSIYNLCLYEKGLLLNSSVNTRNFVFAQNDSKLQIKYNELSDLKNKLLKDIQANKPNQFVIDKIDKIEKELAIVSAYFRNEQFQNSIDVDQIKNALDSNEVAIEFTYFKNNGRTTYVALILNANKENIEVVELFDENDLASVNKLSRINYVNALYSNSDEIIKVRKNNITPLYNLIWNPIMPYLDNINKIYYSGAGLLQRLNLEAIPIDSEIIMGQKFKMENLISTRNIIKKVSINSYDNSSYIVGGVNYDYTPTDNLLDQDIANAGIVDEGSSGVRSADSYWKYLPYSKSECDAIVSTLQNNDFNVTFLNEGFATELNFKNLGTLEKSPQVIHLATHGFFFSDPSTTTLLDSSVIYEVAENAMFRSGLVLAGANGSWKGEEINTNDDGILTAFEVSNMNLTNTELVVLSACETGLGEISGNEGVYGFQRAFKKAGSKYLIMSLWKIPDEETSNFMTGFYNAWQNENLNIRDAFSKTQVQMRAKYKDPYKWAGFVLIE